MSNQITRDIQPPTRENILYLQAALQSNPQACCELPEPQNMFAPGVYGRKIEVKAGTLLVGKTHAFDHFFVLAKGKVMFVTEDSVDVVEAGYVAVGRADIKRVGYVLEDCVMLNFHSNPFDCTDMDLLEQVYVKQDQHDVDHYIEMIKNQLLEEKQ